MSIALLIEWRGFRMFAGGDIEKFTEQKIADLDDALDVDVYKADHHGSDTSTSSDFIRDLAPTVVIISNGDDGKYNHPRQVTLDTLAVLPGPPTVFQTNRYTKGPPGGDVDDAHIADLDPSGPEGTIHVAVDGTAGRYVVSYGTTSDTFAIKARQAATQAVVIESLLPNPVGSDRDLEEVTIRNDGPGVVDLTGWWLQDAAGRRWPLTELGTVAAGASETTVRHGFPMNLNNDGDTVTLIDATGQTIDQFTYSTSSEGVRITTGH